VDGVLLTNAWGFLCKIFLLFSRALLLQEMLWQRHYLPKVWFRLLKGLLVKRRYLNSNRRVLTFAFANMEGEVISEKYVLEYGTDCLEMHVGAIVPAERVIIVDDLVATGGTLCAAIRLLGMCFSSSLCIQTNS